MIKIRKDIGGRAVEEVLRAAAGVSPRPQIGGGLGGGVEDWRTRTGQLDTLSRR